MRRFVGVKELPEGDHPLIQWGFLLCGLSSETPDEVPWPLVGETEVLTNVGWQRFDRLPSVALEQPDLQVMQVNADTGRASLSHFGLTVKGYSGDLHVFERRGLSLACDPNHRFYAEWGGAGLRRGSKLSVRPIKDLREKMCLPLVESYEPLVRYGSLSDIRFFAAYLADGNLKDTNTVQFNVSREDKKEFLRSLGPRGTYERKRLYGKNKIPATNFIFTPPASLAAWLEGPKLPRWEVVLGWNRAERDVFLETYRYFDGTERANGGSTITTTSKRLADVITALLFLSHYRVSCAPHPNSFDGKPCKDLYAIHYSNTKNSLTIAREHRRVEPYSGQLYCVTVPDGAFVARSGSMPFVSGNCSAIMQVPSFVLDLPRSKSARARSWLVVGEEVPLSEAVPGLDVVIMARGDGHQPGPEVIDAPGHVAMFEALDANFVRVLGGNQADAVNSALFPRRTVLGVRRLHSEGKA